MSEYAHVRVALDPLATIYLGDGRRELRIELALSNDPDCDPRAPFWTRSASWTAPAPANSPNAPGPRRARRPPEQEKPMTLKTPIAPPLPDELERLLHRLRLPYVRRAAPEVIATATSQRWEHAEVLKMLLAEEAAGRDRSRSGRDVARRTCRPGRRSTRGNPSGP